MVKNFGTTKKTLCRWVIASLRGRKGILRFEEVRVNLMWDNIM